MSGPLLFSIATLSTVFHHAGELAITWSARSSRSSVKHETSYISVLQAGTTDWKGQSFVS